MHSDLIQRLQDATEGSRELDLDLWWECKANRCSANQPMPEDYRQSNLRMNDAPRYTTSIDAAMTLVAPNTWHEIKGPRKYLHIPTSVPNKWSANLESWNHEKQAMGWGATPALAICIASLKAKEQI